MSTGDLTWTEQRLSLQWELVRRHLEFRDYCDQHMVHFRDGLLTEQAYRLPETERIQARLGLDLVYHYTVRLPPEDFLNTLAFKNPLAVKPLYRQEGGTHDPIDADLSWTHVSPTWMDPHGGHHVRVRVQIDAHVSDTQIADELLERVRDGRGVAGIGKGLSRRKLGQRDQPAVRVMSSGEDASGPVGPILALEIDISKDVSDERLQSEIRDALVQAREKAGINKEALRGAKDRRSKKRVPRYPTLDAFKIFDMRRCGKTYGQIAKAMWPKDWNNSSDDERADTRYRELCREYKKRGVKDWDGEAYREAYLGRLDRQRLYQRVVDNIHAVERRITRI